ncbi:MAG: hypothetical protein IIC80_07635, partial [Chloroflexi bacterium]|nr:hypothetical protein [Chloroflexota bacterium]
MPPLTLVYADLTPGVDQQAIVGESTVGTGEHIGETAWGTLVFRIRARNDGGKALRKVQRSGRIEALFLVIVDELEAGTVELGDCSNAEELAIERYLEELEDEEREHAVTINQCATLALRVIELEEELGRGPIGRTVWIAGLNDLEGTWVEAILLGGKVSLGSLIPDDPVPVTRPLDEVRFVSPGSGVVSKPTGGEHDQGQYDYDEAIAVPAICGALMICTTEALRAVELSAGEYFRRSFFMYKEDIDLSLRMAEAGFEVLYDSGLKAWHCRGWQRRYKMPYKDPEKRKVYQRKYREKNRKPKK